LENDLKILNDLLSEEKINDAKNVVCFWNTWNGTTWKDRNGTIKTGNFPQNLYSHYTTFPKYEIRDEENKLITEPYLYLNMIKDLYFREQSKYNTYKA
jgi:hypothetical protein